MDLAAIIQGGLGIAAGGNINPEGVSMFEPMGGSATKYTGMNIVNPLNPLAAISAGGMRMDTLGARRKGARTTNTPSFRLCTRISDELATRGNWGTT